MNKLLVVGTVAFDAIETPFGKTDKILGGAATYIALSASHFDIDTAIVSVVGGDFPEEHLTLLKNKNVDISGLEIVKEGKTFFWKGKYHNDLNMRDTLDTQLNVLEKFQPVVPKAYTDSDIVMLGNLHPAVQLSVLEQMTQKPKMVVLDTMNFWMDIALEPLKAVIARVDVLTINDEEARQLSGERSLMKAARAVLKMGPRYLVIKKGEHGSILSGPKGLFVAPAYPLKKVVDPTGAGDTFAGGLMAHVARTGNGDLATVQQGMAWGTVMASFTIEAFGLERLRRLDAKQINERMQRFQHAAKVG